MDILLLSVARFALEGDVAAVAINKHIAGNNTDRISGSKNVK
jgi:hypothetical protein